VSDRRHETPDRERSVSWTAAPYCVTMTLIIGIREFFIVKIRRQIHHALQSERGILGFAPNGCVTTTDDNARKSRSRLGF
jgi:hypothetical protein